MTALLKFETPAHPRQAEAQAKEVNRPLVGLAALARLAMRGESLLPVAQSLLARLAVDPTDASALLDLSTVEQLLGASDNRIALQNQALSHRRIFSQPGKSPAPRADVLDSLRADALDSPRADALDTPRLLVLVAPGDFMANTPVEFLLEDGDLHVDYLYVEAGQNLLRGLPPHDVAFVAVAESQANRPILETIARAAPAWPRPLLNAPEAIARLTRDGAWSLLHEAEGVLYPRNFLARRDEVLTAVKPGDYPIIIRPQDSHAGSGLEKIEDAQALRDYLRGQGAEEFALAPFVDYSGPDGLFRKMRIAFVDGAAYPIHLAVSPRWMIHYLNADMTANAANRAEEARFMEAFSDFAEAHSDAFAQLRALSQLDYFLIDCAQSRDGRLLVFEIGAAMIAHDLDCPVTFPYKSGPMRQLFQGFQRMILQHAIAARRAPA